MIRPFSDDIEEQLTPRVMRFDVLFVYDQSQDLHGKFAEILDFETDGYLDDDEFVMDQIEIPVDAGVDDCDVKKSIECVEKVYAMRVCTCFRHFVKHDDHELCYVCQMTLPSHSPGGDEIVCAVCRDVVVPSAITIQSCCHQHLHRKCLELWLMRKSVRSCPLCRADT